MARNLPDRARRLLSLQRGVIARWQAPEAGLKASSMASFVRSGRWQRLGPGVYAAHSGELTREAVLWAALLRAGRGAVLSHETAAELDKLKDGPSAVIHVTVPVDRHPLEAPGVTIHRSCLIEQTRHPGLDPPRTMIEETVLDLTQAAAAFDDAFGWIARACQRGLTTPTLLRIRMDMRKKLRWRTELCEALSDVDHGVHSVLEYRYLRHVERAHSLPRAHRQARASVRGRTAYRDVLYREYGVAVELDGRAYHPGDERWRDLHRDNATAADGIVTLRYGWADVTRRPCEVALQVSAVLQRRGWTGRGRPCGPSCPSAAGFS